MTEATSLLEWLALYAEDQRGHHETTVAATLQRLLQRAFPVLCEDTCAAHPGCNGWELVLNVLEQFYEMPLGIDKTLVPLAGLADANAALIRLLEFALGAVVQCEEKAAFVRDIMTMSDAVQVDLMAIIERVMVMQSNQMSSGIAESATDNDASNATSVADDADTHDRRVSPESPLPPRSLLDSNETTPHSPLYLARNAELERAKRENELLKDENVRLLIRIIHVSRELRDAKSKLQHIETDNRTLVETIQQLELQLEVDVLRKERAVRALYDERIQVLERDLESANANLHGKAAIANEVKGLRDEVDLLRPLAEKVAKMETLVAKYKVKIEELTSAKEKLRRVEDTNAELTEKNLGLETQLSKAASLQRKLKEAKAANTAVEFRVSELETLLTRQEHELVRVRSEWEASQSALDEANALNAQLQETIGQQVSAAKLDSASSSDGVAGGISEFNPELMQKLARLEHANQELSKQVDGETSERIDGLLDEVDDLTRLKKSFEARYFDTEQQLQRRCEELDQTRQDVATLETSLSSLQSDMSVMTEHRDRLDAEVQEARAQIEHLLGIKRRLEVDVSEGAQREEAMTESIRDLEKEVYELQSALDALRRDICLLRESKAELESAHSESLCHMTEVMHAKANTIEELRGEKLAIQMEMDKYMEQHSVSNAERNTKECELASEISRLETALRVEQDKMTQQTSMVNEKLNEWEESRKLVQAQTEEQETALKETIRSQLSSNQHLLGTNQALKSELKRKTATIVQLESAMTRLESKVVLLEKERAHISSQEERKREVEAEETSFSAQLNIQVGLVVAELEKLQKEHTDLRQRVHSCQCRHGGSQDQTDESKRYYLNRIRQLEQGKRHEEDRRRELLLVNAKLIQEQKRFQTKNTILVNEMQQLREKMNSWLLRDERRRKEGEMMQKRVQALESKYQLATKQVEHRCDLDREKRTASEERSEDTLPSRPSSDRKRKLGDDVAKAITPSISTDSGDGFVDGSAFFASAAEVLPAALRPKPPKRRMSLFMASRLHSQPPPPTAEEEKPSECQQQ